MILLYSGQRNLMIMDTKQQTGSSPNWLRWGQPVEETETSREDHIAETTAANRIDRVDRPNPAENRIQLRDRLLKMIVHTEQARKAHSSRR